ncbi:MAG: ion channel [Chloroflexi bacterium]|nr:ion channel [Chloroflexota bacterium]
MLVSTYRSSDRISHLRTNWIDVLIVLLPFLRPLRVFRVLRAAKLVVFTVRVLSGLRDLTGQSGFRPTLGVGLLLLIGLALVTSIAESESSSNIDGAGDAIWWAFVTATTVGYGDAIPVTGAGRIFGVLTMIVGISIFGAVTAYITTFLVRGSQSNADLLSQINNRLEKIEMQLSTTAHDSDSRE